MENIKRKKVNGNSKIYTKVINSLEKNNYKYRTLEGMSKETGLSQNKIWDVIQKHPDEVVELYRTDKFGRKLFSTRRKYKKVTGVSEKIIGVLLNRVY